MNERLAVNDIYATIQGEGVHSGRPIIIVRLQGCGVGCPWCDTKQTWARGPAWRRDSFADARLVPPAWTLMDPDDIAATAETLCKAGPVPVVVTGGEPAEQPLASLVAALHAKQLPAHLETSGTALGHVGAMFDWVCCSPKPNMPGNRPILCDALRPAHEVKWIVGKRSDLERLREFLDDHASDFRPDLVVSVQPLSQNVNATQLCVDASLALGYHVSIQVHKLLGVP